MSTDQDRTRLAALDPATALWLRIGESDVEIAEYPNGDVLMRKAGHPEPVLAFTEDEWTAFKAGARNGEFSV